MTEKPLNARQRRFVAAYQENPNGTAAARLAGYSGDDATLAQVASRLLRNAKVAAALAAEAEVAEKSSIATRRERREFWTAVMRGEVTEPRPVRVGDEVTIEQCEPALRDRLKAAELLGKSRGDFVEKVDAKVEHSGSLLAEINAVLERRRKK